MHKESGLSRSQVSPRLHLLSVSNNVLRFETMLRDGLDNLLALPLLVVARIFAQNVNRLVDM